ncbi:MAG: SBBP repeat-containing protein [Candidatus Cloacimonetes bacterium]|nr:SBBP repeat-containing protein [Candidatus Cloacimonadota bacterium]
MKKRTFILLVLLFIAVLAFAQAPEWQWATQAGGTNSDGGKAITIDAAGNSYVTGTFRETATFGSYSLTSSGYLDIFVAKMDEDGNWLWATRAGGGSWDWDCGCGITIDDAGNSYVTGGFNGTASFGSFSITSGGDDDIFVAKMDANGNWQWATRAGGTYIDFGYGITIDNAGNSYVTGTFAYTASFGSFSLTSSGDADIFVAKMDATGNWLWVTQAGGGTSVSRGYGITIDDAGNSYVTGFFYDTITFGSYSLTSSGMEDIFVAKMNAEGNWQWAAKAGGTDCDYGKAITIDNAGNSCVTGYFYDTATFGSYSLTSSGDADIFVAKIDANGNWQWAIQAGGSVSDGGNGITIDDFGNSYVTGYFMLTATFGPYSLTSSGSWDSDIFVAKMDVDGNWQWAIQAGGDSWDQGSAITIDDFGNSYVTGYFMATATFGPYSLTSSGSWDIFVAKLGSNSYAENEISTKEIGLSNYPNPFNPSGAGRSTTTTIYFNISRKDAKNANLEIYNIKGQKIKTLQILQSAIHNPNYVVWNGTDGNNQPVSSGIYFYQLISDKKTIDIKRMLLLE